MGNITAGPAGRVISSGIGVITVAAMSVTFAISFAAIIYTGPLEQFLSRGIGLTLIAGLMMGLVGVGRFSYAGTIAQPQDVTAILLAIAAGSIAAGSLESETLFATVATLGILATFFTGIIAYAFGRMGLGYLARFIPFPVLAGFLVATGYLLTIGALGMVLRTPLDIYSLGALLAPEAPAVWLPLIGLAVLTTVLTRIWDHPLVLPGVLVAATAGFYGMLPATGRTLEDARAMGLLLGPFEGGSFLDGLHPGFPLAADGQSLLAQAPTILGVTGMAILGGLMNATGLGLSIKRDIDTDRDLRAVGLCNLAASPGGMSGFHLIGETLFARRMGITGLTAGLTAAAGCGLALFFGAGWLSALPIGLFALVIAYLGIDLLYQWLWVQRRDLPPMDYALVLMILGVAATVGFLPALATGLLAAALLFISSYARIDPVRLRSTVAARRSLVERGAVQEAMLTAAGGATLIYELNGYLFFGTAHKLDQKLRAELAGDPQLRRIILDFTRVPDLDASGAFALGTLAQRCTSVGVDLWCSGVASGAGPNRRFPIEALQAEGVQVFATLSDALEAAEEMLLTEDAVSDRAVDVLSRLRAQHPDLDPLSIFPVRALARNETLVTQGDPSRALYLLLSGQLQAEIEPDVMGNPRRVVARFLPGAPVGEIAFYSNTPRSATVRASTDARVLVISPEALETGSQAEALARSIHRFAAETLANRVARLNRLLQASGA